MTSSQWQSNIVPAQLSYLAIYNPALGPTEETFDQQLCFYYSRAAADAKAAQRSNGKTEPLPNQSNEQLRRIGLAQGLVDFAKAFSNGEPVDSVETEKSRIVLHQLEENWWLLASIDLTRIPLSSTTPQKAPKAKAEPEAQQYEYSSREVSPPALLVQQIKQAQSIFTLHHGPSLTYLHSRSGRHRFCSILERFWTRFARTWDVLLHGNPAADALSGIKLASGGELGFGAGEEDWGSGERCVLEEFIQQTEGLIDIAVARFGEPVDDADYKTETVPWIGAGKYPEVTDGIIFGGVGGITRPSLQSISLWMRHIYTYGENAYGVRDNPSRERKRRKRRNLSEQINMHKGSTQRHSQGAQRSRSSSRSIQRNNSGAVDPSNSKDTRPRMEDRIVSRDHAEMRTDHPKALAGHPGIPPPILSAAEAALNNAAKKAEQKSSTDNVREETSTLGIPDQYVKFLTLGLSTLVMPAKAQPPLPSRTSSSSSRTLIHGSGKTCKDPNITRDSSLSMLEPIPDGDAISAGIARQQHQEDKGYFLIGLKGDLDDSPADEDADLTEGSFQDTSDGNRTVLRTVFVNTARKASPYEDDSDETLDANPDDKLTRLRVLVYVHRPFIYCFLFEQRTSSLTCASLYRNIHRNLIPVHKPLLSSTQASRVTDRNIDADTQHGSHAYAGTDVYNLLFNPLRLTVHASVPNIPDPGSLAAEGILSNARNTHATSWTRLDAINVHSAILNTLHSATRHKGDIEMTSRTHRDWWVVWMKLPASEKQSGQEASLSSAAQHQSESQPRVAIIVRKAVDTQSVQASTSSRAASGMWSLISRSGESTPDQATGLSSGGIGFDARKYIEGILSLNR